MTNSIQTLKNHHNDNMWQLQNLKLTQALLPIFNVNQKIYNEWNGVFHLVCLTFHGISQ